MWSKFLDWLLQLRRRVGFFAASQAVSFKPPASWADLILDRSLINMLFMVIANSQLFTTLLKLFEFITVTF